MLIEVNQRLDFSSISVFFGFKNKAIYKKNVPIVKIKPTKSDSNVPQIKLSEKKN